MTELRRSIVRQDRSRGSARTSVLRSRLPPSWRQAPGLLLFEPISWRPRRRAWRLDDDVAGAMGAFFRSSRVQLDGPDVAGAAHGDWTPWNMLWTDAGWFLIDWEEASDTAPPFFDLCHHLVQSHSLLGHPTLPKLLRGFRARRWLGGERPPVVRERGRPAGGRWGVLPHLVPPIDRGLDPRGPEERGRRPRGTPDVARSADGMTGVRIVAFAYACEPESGSEPGAGWMWARMLARLGETWVITRENNRAAIDAALPTIAERDRLHFEYVDLPAWARFWKRGPRGVHRLLRAVAVRRAEACARLSMRRRASISPGT